MENARYAVAKDGVINPRTVAETALEAKVRGLAVFFNTIHRPPEGLIEDVWSQWLLRLSEEEPGTELKVVEV